MLFSASAFFIIRILNAKALPYLLFKLTCCASISIAGAPSSRADELVAAGSGIAEKSQFII